MSINTASFRNVLSRRIQAFSGRQTPEISQVKLYLESVWAGISNVGMPKPEEMQDLFNDDDENIGMMFLLAFCLGHNSYGKSQLLQASKDAILRNSSRWIRREGVYYLFRQGIITPPAKIVRVFELRSRHYSASNLDEFDIHLASNLLTLMKAMVDGHGNEEYPSRAFRGQTVRWEFQNGYPIMTALYSQSLNFDELLFIDPNRSNLSNDLNLLQGFNAVKKAGQNYSLINPDSWREQLAW